MARNRKYELDLSDLQYKMIRLPWKAKFIRVLIWFGISIAITLFYCFLFQKSFGSPKEKLLVQQIENIKLQYSLLNRDLNNSYAVLSNLKSSDHVRYRTILELDSIPESYRRGGYGGTERFTELKGYLNSDLLISFRLRIEELKNMSNVQKESFGFIDDEVIEWKREMEHYPGISPVSVSFRLGDDYKFRPIHPVLGTPRMHNGQDFIVPYGTSVYATGDGTVVESGWNNGGFGNYVVIDHDYGLQSLYGHLSEIRVPKGMNVKRGDLIGLSGSSGTSTGPHLHYQIEEKGRAIDPKHYINNDMTPEEWNEMIQVFASRSKYK